MSFRIGQGFDAHAFSADPGRALVLGGVVITGAPGLAGHSDADVVCHAVADALLGAAALGDIGSHFPDDDEHWAGADSVELLGRVLAMTADAGWRPVNVDCTVIAQSPRLAPHAEAMRSRLSGVLGAPVSVKASTTDHLGAVGRGEGIACLAIALVGPVPGSETGEPVPGSETVEPVLGSGTAQAMSGRRAPAAGVRRAGWRAGGGAPGGPGAPPCRPSPGSRRVVGRGRRCLARARRDRRAGLGSADCHPSGRSRSPGW